MPIEIAWAFTTMFLLAVLALSYAVVALTSQNRGYQAILGGLVRKWSQHAIEIKNPTVLMASQQIEKDRIALAARMNERGASPDVMARLWNEQTPVGPSAQADYSGRATLDEDIDD